MKLLKSAYVILLVFACALLQVGGAAIPIDATENKVTVQKSQPLLLEVTTIVNTMQDELDVATLLVNERDLDKAASRDDGATIAIAEQASGNPAPLEAVKQSIILMLATSRDILETFKLEEANEEAVSINGFEVEFLQTVDDEMLEERRRKKKDAKRKLAELLLSTAKVHEKTPKNARENIDSHEKLPFAQSGETITIKAALAYNENKEVEEAQNKKNKHKSELYESNDTTNVNNIKMQQNDRDYNESKESTESAEDQGDEQATISDSTTSINYDDSSKSPAEVLNAEDVAVAEFLNEPHNDNVVTAVLIETEPDYVVLDGGDLETLDGLDYVSFTYIGSKPQWQPIVQSVEIAPRVLNE